MTPNDIIYSKAGDIYLYIIDTNDIIYSKIFTPQFPKVYLNTATRIEQAPVRCAVLGYLKSGAQLVHSVPRAKYWNGVPFLWRTAYEDAGPLTLDYTVSPHQSVFALFPFPRICPSF